MSDELERDIATTVGASEIAAIVGEDPYRTPEDVWNQKVNGERTPENEHIIRGKVLEPSLLNWWERIDGRKLDLRQYLFRHPNGWACATADGVATETRHLVEVKCPVGGKQWDDRSGAHPWHYRLQSTWQLGIAMAATGNLYTAELCAGPLWGRLMRFGIDFDADLFAGLLAKAEEFMTFVRSGKPLPSAQPQEAAK